MLYLKELNRDDSLKEYKFFKELPAQLNGFINPYIDVDYEEFTNISIPNREKYSKGIDLSEGYVPDTYYFLWEDEEIIGLFKVRHHLNEKLLDGSGHIGYAILPKYWNKGYATKGLKLAIEKLVKLPTFKEKEIYLCCDLDNVASLAVMLKNGGYIHHQDDKEYHVRIKV